MAKAASAVSEWRRVFRILARAIENRAIEIARNRGWTADHGREMHDRIRHRERSQYVEIDCRVLERRDDVDRDGLHDQVQIPVIAARSCRQQTRNANDQSQESILNQRVAQLRQQITGAEKQLESVRRQNELIRQENEPRLRLSRGARRRHPR